MSERKVLNKYYPPDFDPSKVPKSKVKRNATFEIRLMAPCNMRCTTCGEYIYKVSNDEDIILTAKIYLISMILRVASSMHGKKMLMT